MSAIHIGSLVAVFFLVLFVFFYNGFVRLRNKCEEAFATMDAYLKKRWDLIPNLVAVVKGYAAHEADTLERVVSARRRAIKADAFKERQCSESELGAGLQSLFALRESYPELKASSSFNELQKQLIAVENDILQSRKYYNAVVKVFNTQRELFPHSIVGGMMGLKKRAYFLIDEDQRNAVSVSL